MADMSDLQGWAQREGGEDPSEGGGGEQAGKEQQPPAPPAEVYRHAAQEMQETIDMLGEMPGDDDQEWRADVIATLQETMTSLNEKAEEVEGDEEEEEEDEDEDGDEEEDQAAAG